MNYLDKTFQDLTEKLGQVTKQKDQAYSERNKVVAAFARLLYANGIQVGIAQHIGIEWHPDWRTILVIDSSKGIITWHFHDSEKYLLKGFPTYKNYQYDGHTTEEKYQRLFDLVGIKNNKS